MAGLRVGMLAWRFACLCPGRLPSTALCGYFRTLVTRQPVGPLLLLLALLAAQTSAVRALLHDPGPQLGVATVRPLKLTIGQS